MSAQRAGAITTANRAGLGWTVAVLVLAALGAGGFYGYRRLHQAPPPPRPLGVMPMLPKKQEETIREAVRQFGRMAMGITPDQEKRIDEIWRHQPTSLDELIAMSRKTDALLSPSQQRVARPLRRMIRNGVIDQMLEPARRGFPPADFEKFKNEIKRRVERRVEG